MALGRHPLGVPACNQPRPEAPGHKMKHRRIRTPITRTSRVIQTATVVRNGVWARVQGGRATSAHAPEAPEGGGVIVQSRSWSTLAALTDQSCICFFVSCHLTTHAALVPGYSVPIQTVPITSLAITPQTRPLPNLLHRGQWRCKPAAYIYRSNNNK